NKSISLKKWYYTFVVLEGVISTFIPFTTLFLDVWSITRYIVALMSTVVALISIILTTFGFHNKWIDYRTTAENLKREKDRYECELSPYKGENREQLLFDKAAEIIVRENNNWKVNELEQLKNPLKTHEHK
ncbi:MAG: DUF4231 domain-containing protein, partial [Paludibacter sp.]